MFALSSSCFSENARNETLPFQFTATGYSSELLQNMSRLFTDECLCDVGLVIQPDRLIRAHRCVLSAASPYFHAMLTCGLRESSADVIDMQAVGAPHVIEKLVEFIYTGATGAHLLALISVSVDHILRLVGQSKTWRDRRASKISKHRRESYRTGRRDSQYRR